VSEGGQLGVYRGAQLRVGSWQCAAELVVGHVKTARLEPAAPLLGQRASLCQGRGVVLDPRRAGADVTVPCRVVHMRGRQAAGASVL
jgi:hypothetical protein